MTVCHACFLLLVLVRCMASYHQKVAGRISVDMWGRSKHEIGLSCSQNMKTQAKRPQNDPAKRMLCCF